MDDWHGNTTKHTFTQTDLDDGATIWRWEKHPADETVLMGVVRLERYNMSFKSFHHHYTIAEIEHLSDYMAELAEQNGVEFNDE